MQKREKYVLLLYTLFNAISNQFIPLYSDEAYYWLWSKKLDFSYFDHPPMVAYLIKVTTLLGDSPFFVRLGSVFLVSATAYIVYRLAKKMFDEKTAIYTFYIFISSILVIVASTLVTPDVPLMFFTALFLFWAYLYLESYEKKYALLSGVAAGAMLLSKYTGILVIFTLFVYILIYKRQIFKSKYLYLSLGIAIVVFSPVLYWNYVHDFISFTFQIHHGIAEKKIFNSTTFLNFVGAQFILFHPLYLLPLLYFIMRDKNRFERKKVYLLLPFLFTLLFFSYFSAFKHANAQWAGLAYMSGSILLGYYFSLYNKKKLLAIALALSGFIWITLKIPLSVHYIKPIQNIYARLGQIDHFSREIDALAMDIDSYDYILIDNYHGSEIAYYFQKYKNVLVLNDGRFSNFNLWRNDDLHISMHSPLRKIPSLGRCLYIGHDKYKYKELESLFGNVKVIAHMQKKVANETLNYYFAEFTN
jgi:4-amino-4-deoxy-L-arabinose transferase-like glycosyltransferase